MKRLSVFAGAVLALLLAYGKASATVVQDAPISYTKSGTAITVSISTSAWTIGNTSTSYVAQRSGFRVTNPAGNSYAVYSICHSTTPVEAITVLTNEVQPGENLTMPCGGGLNLYLLSLTAAQNIDVWEMGQ